MAHAAKKILVTGATGMVGSCLTQQLVSGGADVRIFRRATSSMDLLASCADHVEHAVGDVTDPASLLRAMEDVDQVYHAAAKVGFSPRDRETLRRVNVEGTANVVNAALATGIDRLVHTSSIAALGPPNDAGTPVDETSEWDTAPATPSDYARSKHNAEMEVHRGIAEGLDAVMVNPSLIFGVGRPGENTRRIVDAVRHRRLPAVPPGTTSVVDVEDVAAGMRKAMVRGETSRRYVLTSENLTWQTLTETLADAFGVRPPTRTVPSSLLKAGAYVAEAVSFVTRTEPVLTRATAETATQERRYDNRRARDELGCTFRPFAATARRIAGQL